MNVLAKFFNAPENAGLLLMRVGFGGLMMNHGWDKVAGGPEKWKGLGGWAMGTLGIDFLPTFWGFMAAFAEFFGAFGVLIGLFTRLNASLAAFTMLIAAAVHLVSGDGLEGSEPAIVYFIAFAALMMTGPGKYSIDARIG